MKSLVAAILLLSSFIPVPGVAADAGSIRLENAFTRSAPAGGVGAFYVTIDNTGGCCYRKQHWSGPAVEKLR